jgi:hypothetical protein
MNHEGTGTLSLKRYRSFVPLRGEFYSTTPTIKLTEQAALKRDPHWKGEKERCNIKNPSINVPESPLIYDCI